MHNEDRVLTGFALEAGAFEVRAAYRSEIARLQTMQREYAEATARLTVLNDEGARLIKATDQYKRASERLRRIRSRRQRQFERQTYALMVGLTLIAMLLGWSLHALYTNHVRGAVGAVDARAESKKPSASSCATH